MKWLTRNAKFGGALIAVALAALAAGGVIKPEVAGVVGQGLHDLPSIQ